MNEHIGLTRGNPQNLEGRVLFYARVKVENPDNLPSETLIMAMYTSQDYLDLIERTHMDESNIAYIQEQLSLAEKEAKELYHSKNPDADLSKVKRNRISLMFPLLEESTIQEGTNDIWFTGSFNFVETAIRALRSAQESYFALFSDQEIDAEEKTNETLDQSLEHLFDNNFLVVSHKEYQGQDIYQFVMQTYVTQLLDAKKYQDEKRFELLKKQFSAFSSFSTFDKYASELSTYIEKTPKPNLELVDAYARLINAMHTEVYEEARVQKNKIDALH